MKFFDRRRRLTSIANQPESRSSYRKVCAESLSLVDGPSDILYRSYALIDRNHAVRGADVFIHGLFGDIFAVDLSRAGHLVVVQETRELAPLRGRACFKYWQTSSLTRTRAWSITLNFDKS